jgi:hypothetical protein
MSTRLRAILGTTGLTDIGYRFIAGNAFSGARVTAGVYELPGARGVYGVDTPSFPAGATDVYWDSTGTAGVWAYEAFDFRLPYDAEIGTANSLLRAGTNTATTLATLTVTGAVLFSSTLGITGITTFTGGIISGAISGSTFAMSGAVTLNSLTVTNNLLVSGNSTVTGLTTHTGHVTFIDGFSIPAPSTANRHGVTISGNGSGDAMRLLGGSGSGNGLRIAGFGTGHGIFAQGGDDGDGFRLFGGDVTGSALRLQVGAADPSVVISVGSGPALQAEGDVNFDAGWNIFSSANFASSVVVTGAVNISGATTTTNASNDIRLGATERVNIATAVWNLLTSAITVAGSIGKVLMQAITGTGGTANFTILVTDGINPVQNVDFSLYSGVTLISRGTTDVNGNFTGSGPLGTFSVALSKSGYLFGGATRTITGNGTGTLNTALAMTPVVIPTPPVSASLCILYGYLVDSSGNPLAGATLVATPVPKDVVTRPVVTDAGSIFSFTPIEAVSDGVGYVELVLVRTSVLSHPVTYSLSSSNGQIARHGVKLVDALKNLNSL